MYEKYIEILCGGGNVFVPHICFTDSDGVLCFWQELVFGGSGIVGVVGVAGGDIFDKKKSERE